jgi:hypothetical protein
MEGISPQYLLSRTRELREYTVAFLSRLIKAPSLSGREEQVVRLLEEEFEKAGAEEVRVDGLGNVMARLGSRGPTFAFDGFWRRHASRCRSPCSSWVLSRRRIATGSAGTTS